MNLSKRKIYKPVAAVTILLLGGLLSGCKTTIPEHTPVLSIATPVTLETLETNASTLVATYDWLGHFNDRTLDELVEEAMVNSPDLKLALARMESASQSAKIARSDLLPSASVGLNSSYREINGSAFDAYGEDDFRLTLGTSWEVDLWGKVRNASSSANALWRASAYDYEQAKHSIAANIGIAWYDLVAAKQQLNLAKDTLQSYSSTAELIKNRYESGIDSALDYRLALANAEGAKSSVSRREELYKRAKRSLQLMLGRYPDGGIVEGADFPTFSSRLPAGIPSDLLSRRPDMRAVERRLASAEALVSNASKQRLPSIQITGATGTQTSEFKNILDGNFDFWNVSATVSQTLFSGGRLNANHKRAVANYEQSVALYEQAALRAFSEVEQAIDADVFFANLEVSSRSAAEQSREAENLARDQYSAGLTNIVTVLEAQRRALIAKQSYIDARNSRVQNRIRLYLAMGGDF